MRKLKLSGYEQAIESAAEEFVPASKSTINDIARALAARRKDVVISIRLNRIDLEQIKDKARRYGVKYQALISELVHQAAVN